MKKIIAVLIAIIMSIGMCEVVNAEDMNYTQTSEVSFTAEGHFTVYIPSKIEVGEVVEITADVELPENKAVSVMFDTLPDSGTITLTKTTGVDTVEIYFMQSDGTQITNANRLLGIFRSDSIDTVYQFSSAAVMDSDVSPGTYTGSVNFYISYIDVD